jgi:2-succinyl-6-hydroxy-2,4-cyclohexadiene-1-carboxylate synthase
VLAPLILLHGFTQTRQSWRRTANELAGRYRAITPDLPGHGQSAHKTASFDACSAYLRALAPSAPFTLAGYSMGGRIALTAAFQLPIDRLILVGASPGIADDAERARRRAADEALADRIEQIGVEAFAAEWAAQPLFAGQPDHVALAAGEDRRRNTAHGLAAALRGLGTGTMEPLWDRLPELRMPVTLLVGERDEKFRAIATQMAYRIAEADVHVIPRAGHAAQLERPDTIASYLRSEPPSR